MNIHANVTVTSIFPQLIQLSNALSAILLVRSALMIQLLDVTHVLIIQVIYLAHNQISAHAIRAIMLHRLIPS